ncbi:hypothetical protein L7F22_039590 [Adiantum nelumboides]|nr:hypothetical protein [Adiantum nelumboides]
MSSVQYSISTIAQSFQANAINLSPKAMVAAHCAITLPKSIDFEDLGASQVITRTNWCHAVVSLQEQCFRQQRIAEITKMIQVASLLHDDVLDSADTRRGIGSLNFGMGNKQTVLAGDFLLYQEHLWLLHH